MFWAPKKVNSWETLGIAQGNLTAATHVFIYCVTYTDHAINKLLHAHAERALHSPRHTEAHTMVHV